MKSREPMINAPAVVVWTLGLIVVVHLALTLLSEQQRIEVLTMAAVLPQRYGPGLLHMDNGLLAISSLLTHQLVHWDWMHLIMNSAWLLAFGSAVAARIGTWRFLVFGGLSGVAGALAFIPFHLHDQTVMVGASGALSGYMGGAFRFLFSAFDQGGPAAFRDEPEAIQRMSLRALMADRRAVIAIGIWVVVNLLTAVAAPLFTTASGIAWEAHLGGFAFGLLTFGLFDRQPSAPASDTLAV
ncbi:MAG: rhomboid family intramembrane serine protease [Hyphomicrobiaceae bacterium]